MDLSLAKVLGKHDCEHSLCKPLAAARTPSLATGLEAQPEKAMNRSDTVSAPSTPLEVPWRCSNDDLR